MVRSSPTAQRSGGREDQHGGQRRQSRPARRRRRTPQGSAASRCPRRSTPSDSARPPRGSARSARPSRRRAAPGRGRTRCCRRPGRRSRGSIGLRAVEVRRHLGDAGALDQHDHGDGHRADDQVEGESCDKCGTSGVGMPLGIPRVLHAGHAVGPSDQQRGHDQRYERPDGGDRVRINTTISTRAEPPIAAAVSACHSGG